MSQPNPYVSSAYVPPPTKDYRQGTRKLDYGAMFRFLFTNPNWMMNLMWCSLCFLVAYVIPILPQLVVIGYLFEQLERLHVRQDGTYDDFDTNRFMDYLVRGLWPMLAAILLMLIVMVILVPLTLLGFGGGMALMANQNEEAGFAVFLLTTFGLMVAAIPLQLVLLPIMLRAGLTQELGGAFSLAWIKDFLRRTWLEILVGTIVLTIANYVITLAGLLLFCIGVLPAMSLTMFAFMHFQWQVYEIYIDRGGTPLVLKPKPDAPPKYV